MPPSPAGQAPGRVSDPGGPLTTIRRGMIWFAAGGAVIIITHLLRVWGPGPLARLGPLIPMCAGAYGLVVGLEKMIAGLGRSFAVSDAAARARARRGTVSCVLLIAAALGSGAAAWWIRAPYWGAITSRDRGERASEKLRAIAERHAATMQAGATGAAALTSWRESASAALPLRPEFTAALDGASYLETPSGGRLRARARIDKEFYRLCLEWMDLYESVQRSLNEVSMLEPPEEWSVKQNDIIDRIQALPTPPQEGS